MGLEFINMHECASVSDIMPPCMGFGFRENEAALAVLPDLLEEIDGMEEVGRGG